jgi:hypothetical protein
MSIDAFKQELASLDVKDRHRIIAYLVEINQRENPALRARWKNLTIDSPCERTSDLSEAIRAPHRV